MNAGGQPISEPSPAASSSAVLPTASPCGVPASVPYSNRTEWAKAGIGIVAGVMLTLAVEVWAFVNLGFIRLKDPQAAEKAVSAAYLDEVYTTIAVNPQED